MLGDYPIHVDIVPVVRCGINDLTMKCHSNTDRVFGFSGKQSVIIATSLAKPCVIPSKGDARTEDDIDLIKWHLGVILRFEDPVGPRSHRGGAGYLVKTENSFRVTEWVGKFCVGENLVKLTQLNLGAV